MLKFKSNWCLSFFIASIHLILVGCNRDASNLDWNRLKGEYSKKEDSTKLLALEYLEKQLETLKSQHITLNSSRDDKIINLTDLADLHISQDSIIKMITDRGYHFNISYVFDREILTDTDIKAVIDEVFAVKNDLPWWDDIPTEILHDYLLSYKVGWEYPEPWRRRIAPIFIKDYQKWSDTTQTRYVGKLKTAYIDAFVNKIVIPRQKEYYVYSTKTLKIGDLPSYSSLQIIKGGDCLSEALIDNYLLKAAGIPASYDIIPYWGSANGMHATAVYYNPGQQKMRLLTGLLYYPAKVFRRTFTQKNVWSDTIKPIIENRDFRIDFLKSDQLIDVTAEHTSTVDVRVPIKYTYGSTFAYITVLNYGQWVPIFWAEIKDGYATFQNMGYNMIYRVAVPDENNNLIYENPFYLNLDRRIITPITNTKKHNIVASAVNQGKESTVKEGHTYILYIFSGTGELIPVKRQIAAFNGTIEFENINLSTFYMVADINDERNLARLFSVQKGKQIWH